MSPKILFFSVLSFFITLGIIFIFLYLLFDNTGELQSLVPTVFINAVQGVIHKMESYPSLSFILEHKLMMSIFHFFISFGVGIVLYYTFFVIYAFVISFFNIVFIRHLQKKYYNDVEFKGINMIHTVFFYIKTIIVALVLFLLLSPTYIIPAINILIFVPIYYFFHKTIVFDVSSVINTAKEYKKIKRVNWAELKTRTGFCFLLTLIPVVGILLYPFYILYLGHYIMNETRELRYSNDFHAIKS